MRCFLEVEAKKLVVHSKKEAKNGSWISPTDGALSLFSDLFQGCPRFGQLLKTERLFNFLPLLLFFSLYRGGYVLLSTLSGVFDKSYSRREGKEDGLPFHADV